MSQPSLPEMPLTLVLHSSEAELSGGVAVQMLGGARGRLVLAPELATLEIALPALSRAEIRYAVDQAVKSVDGLIKVGDVEIHGKDVDDDTLLTVALDMHHRSKGRARIPENEPVNAAMKRIGASEDLCRSWVNEDPATRTSIAIANDVVALGESEPSVCVTVLDDEALRREGLNLLLAVGGGSKVSPPRLVLAEYRPEGNDSPPLAIVGKGITFDTGGINVKPYASFVSMMKNDMAGSAVAFALFRALVEAKHKEPLLLVIPTCENAVGAASMRPGAVVKSYAGKTVRIDHTDAEGRLVLADGIAYAQAKYSPREFLCFATLTTSALNSYGPYATPVHFADSSFQAQVEAAAEKTGEDFHFFPKRIWHELANRDQEADLRNTARLPGNASAGAGSRNAAHFLIEFSQAPLCHLDIFASGWNWSGEAPGTGYGATGAPLRTLLRALQPASS